MKIFYFTFGQDHRNPMNNRPLKDYWVEVVAKNKKLAKEKMIQEFGRKWANQYCDEQFDRTYFPKGCYRQYEAD